MTDKTLTRDDVLLIRRAYEAAEQPTGVMLCDHILRSLPQPDAGQREWMLRAAEICEEEICQCCWNEDARAAAEHCAETIRAAAANLPETQQGDVCETCHDSGLICTGTSGNDSDGNAPVLERCPECGYGDRPSQQVMVPVEPTLPEIKSWIPCHCFNERDKELCLDKHNCRGVNAAAQDGAAAEGKGE